MITQITTYFNNNMDSFWSMTATHVIISLVSLVVAMIIGIGCGYLIVKYKKTEKAVVGFFQILRIIPSLAVLILLIPIMGTGVAPAMTALILLAIPPILMNTVTGLNEVPEFIIETARGQGMSESQVNRKVRFPLAMPLILSGSKTAMVEIIASATLAAKIGGGGLGELIFTGLGLNRTDLILIGGLSVAILSLGANLIAQAVDRIILKYKYVR